MRSPPHRRRRLAATVAAVAGLAVLAGCGGAETNSTQGGYVTGNNLITVVEPGERKPAPSIEGTDLDGRPLSLDEFAGKTVVINVWGSWCPPCRKEAPDLDATARKLKDDGVEFLGIAVRENAPASRAFNEAQDISYPSLTDPSGRTLLGFAQNLPSQAIPTTWVIDEQGRVAARILDDTTESTLTSLIEDVQASTS